MYDKFDQGLKISKAQIKNIKLLHQKKYRQQYKKIFVEGVRLVEECMATSHIETLIVSQKNELNDRINNIVKQARALQIPVITATEKEFEQISDTCTPQGVALVAHTTEKQIDFKNASFILVLDHIKDPGNVGTMIRSADWFGCDGILLDAQSVELNNPKVVRSTMGSIFRIPCVETRDLYQQLLQLKKDGFRIIAADGNAETSSYDLKKSGKDVVVIGSEAEGLSENLLPLFDKTVSIPKQGAGESLNAAVAAGVLLYQLSR